MKNQIKFRLRFSGLLTAAALVLNWLITSDNSPFNSYFLWHSDLPNWWAALHILPVIVTAVVAGNPHSGSETLFVVLLALQWLIIGLMLSQLLVALRFWRHHR